jgi:hypothetical protein
MVVQIEDPSAGATIEARLYDGPLVEVTAQGGTARFTSNEGRIAIRGGDASSRFVVRIPRDAARVRITVEGRTVFEKTGALVRASTDPDADGVWTIAIDTPAIDPNR